MPVSLLINGIAYTVESPKGQILLDLLRNDCGLMATRFGCGEGLCGACNVLVDGRATTSCITSVEAVGGCQITTLEGLGKSESPHALQQAFIDEQAMQCGYCISGILMSASALLTNNLSPSIAEIRTALDGNFCRCGSHNRIIAAIQIAAETMRSLQKNG
jgi:nicotinate dehydrogenase subunit A